MSWIAAFVLAQWLAPDAAARLPMGESPRAAALCGRLRGGARGGGAFAAA
jgi:hypothetical protein